MVLAWRTGGSDQSGRTQGHTGRRDSISRELRRFLVFRGAETWSVGHTGVQGAHVSPACLAGDLRLKGRAVTTTALRLLCACGVTGGDHCLAEIRVQHFSRSKSQTHLPNSVYVPPILCSQQNRRAGGLQCTIHCALCLMERIPPDLRLIAGPSLPTLGPSFMSYPHPTKDSWKFTLSP